MVALDISNQDVNTTATDQVDAYAKALGVDEKMLSVAATSRTRRRTWRSATTSATRIRSGTTPTTPTAVRRCTRSRGPQDDDPELAARWDALEQCAPGTLGRIVWDFYQRRGFSVPGTPGAVDPLLAQHDWVHCVADYGTSAVGEIEVFTFIASSIPDKKGLASSS